MPVEGVIAAASAVAQTTPRYLATFGPTVDYRSIATDDLRRAMRYRNGPQGSAAPTTRGFFANVSLLVGFAEGEALAAVSRWPRQLHGPDLVDPRLRTTRSSSKDRSTIFPGSF